MVVFILELFPLLCQPHPRAAMVGRSGVPTHKLLPRLGDAASVQCEKFGWGDLTAEP